jgi:hypothetical protein
VQLLLKRLLDFYETLHIRSTTRLVLSDVIKTIYLFKVDTRYLALSLDLSTAIQSTKWIQDILPFLQIYLQPQSTKWIQDILPFL